MWAEGFCLLHKRMIHTNHGELLRIFDTYCRVWKAGGQATLTTSTEGGLLKANLDIQLGWPSAACPGAPPPHLVRPTAWSSSPSSTSAPGHSGARSCLQRRRRRHRGPAAKARSNARAAAYQVSLAAGKVGTASAPCSPPPPPTTINCVNMVDQVCGKKSQYSALLLPAWWQGRQRGKHQRKWGQTWRCIITIPLLITTIHNSNASSTEASHGLHWVLEHLGGHPHQQCRFTQMSRGHLHWRLLEESRYGEMFSLRPGSPSQLKSLTYVLLNALVWPGFIIGLTFPRSLRCWTTTTR